MPAYTFASPRPQNFSIPFPIIRCMTYFPSSPKGFQKLLQSCKYFYSKNQIICVDALRYSDREKKWYSFDYYYGKWISYDLNKCSYKLWPYKELSCVSLNISNLASILAPKIYQCKFKKLSFIHQDLAYDEYALFTSSLTITNFFCDCTKIKHKNGTPASLKDIFKHLINVQKCDIDLWYIKETTTADEIVEVIKSLKSLESIRFTHLTESIDFNLLVDIIREYKSVLFDICFIGTLSNNYKEMLENFINEVLDTKLEKTPLIWYKEQDDAKYRKMLHLRSPKTYV